MEEIKKEKMATVNIGDPTPDRKRRIVEVLYAFLEDKISIAELSGVSRQDMYRMAEAGYVKYKHGRYEEAEKIFRSLIVLDHRNPYFHSMMAAIYQREGRLVEAIMEYDLSLKVNPEDVAVFVNRGEIYLRNHNYRRAAEDFRSAILRDPKGSNLWANRARSLVIALKRQLERDVGKKK
ncbi:MAG: tetratricopeptide repeat protein [Pseudomonadota bacterium]